MDNELERLVEHCHTCQAHQNMPHKAPIHPWEWARNPWQRVHIDYADLNGKNYLIIIDAYSKWLEVIPTRGCNADVTIRELRKIFATHGIPEICVSDNGPAFTSEEFATFMNKNGLSRMKM